ncbi:MAG: retention module-containing protein [Moraxellaceae bacterium]|nr:MAG: retention module-containing protein [Moraxellaceae bacterium]
MANSVATVSALQGQAWAKTPDGTLRPLKVGDAVNADEVVITATGAHIELDFGDAQPVSIAGGQEVTMNRDLWTDLATDNQEAALQDESIQEALTALNNGEDLTEVLEETAAGLAGGGGGGTHDFVQLTRVVEEVDPLAFDYEINNPETITEIQSQSSGAVINQAPDVAPQTFAGDEDTIISGQIIATDNEGDALTYTLTGQPANGVISG